MLIGPVSWRRALGALLLRRPSHGTDLIRTSQDILQKKCFKGPSGIVIENEGGSSTSQADLAQEKVVRTWLEKFEVHSFVIHIMGALLLWPIRFFQGPVFSRYLKLA